MPLPDRDTFSAVYLEHCATANTPLDANHWKGSSLAFSLFQQILTKVITPETVGATWPVF